MPVDSLVWTMTISNEGTVPAVNTMINGFTLTQTSGAACTPVVVTTLPLGVGTIAAGNAVQGNITIDFTGCEVLARFRLNSTFSANGGATTGAMSLNNQVQ